MRGFKQNQKTLKESKLQRAVKTAAFVLVLLVAGSIIYASGLQNRLQNIKTGNKENLQPIGDKPFNVLILGKDTEDFETAGRTDTIMVANIDPKEKKVYLTSIPRDTLVEIKGKKNKINAAYPLGNVDLAKSTIEELLDIEISRFFVLNWQGFESIVDLLGGVWIDVEKPMYYKASNIEVDLKPGRQKLNGNKALGYVRYRSDKMGDLGRIPRQQKFIFALIDSAKKAQNVVKLPGMIDSAADNMRTNASISELLWLSKLFWGFDKKDMTTAILPGQGRMINKISYFVVDKEKMFSIVGGLGSITKERFENGEIGIQAGVYNASGVEGQAKQMADFLASKGFGIYKVGTAGKVQKQTVVYYKYGKEKEAMLVASYIPSHDDDSVTIKQGSQNMPADIAIWVGEKSARAAKPSTDDKTIIIR